MQLFGCISDLPFSLAKSFTSKASNGVTWYKSSEDAVWGVSMIKNDGTWSAPFRLKGTQGIDGKQYIEVSAYISSTSTPTAPTANTAPPTSWSLNAPSSESVWKSSRVFEYVGNGNGTTGPSNSYAVFSGSTWTVPVKISGSRGKSNLIIYRTTTSGVVPSTPAYSTLGSVASPWFTSASGANPQNTDYLWVTRAPYDELTSAIGTFETPYIIKYPKPDEGIVNGGNTGGYTKIKTKILEIGDWNMDGVSYKYVTHGLDVTKIRSVDVMIRSDADEFATIRPIDFSAVGTVTSGAYFVNPTVVTLTRTSYADGGIFDYTSYDTATSYNRGWVTITYEDT
jgi:hypothetical protein